MNNVRERKTISNVMTPIMAIHSNKASKTHKMKPREIKRDRTKTDEGRIKSINKRYCNIAREDKYMASEV